MVVDAGRNGSEKCVFCFRANWSRALFCTMPTSEDRNTRGEGERACGHGACSNAQTRPPVAAIKESISASTCGTIRILNESERVSRSASFSGKRRPQLADDPKANHHDQKETKITVPRLNREQGGIRFAQFSDDDPKDCVANEKHAGITPSGCRMRVRTNRGSRTRRFLSKKAS